MQEGHPYSCLQLKKNKEDMRNLFEHTRHVFKTSEHSNTFESLMEGCESHKAFVTFLCCIKKLPQLPKEIKAIIYSYIFLR